jgi:Rieske Fe-S protein
MSADGVNKERRRFLIATTSVVGAVGAGLAAVPFIQSWQPSAKAQAVGAPVEVNIGKLEPGQLLKVAKPTRPNRGGQVCRVLKESCSPWGAGTACWSTRQPRPAFGALPNNGSQ